LGTCTDTPQLHLETTQDTTFISHFAMEVDDHITSIDNSNPPIARSGKISEAVEPSAAELRAARWIDLTFTPISHSATALTAAVTDRFIIHMQRERPMGRTGQVRMAKELGAIIAGVLRGDFRGHTVSAQRRTNGAMWKNSILGHNAFWTKIDALQRAGLVGVTLGVKQVIGEVGDPFGYLGLPTKLWATQQLRDLAAAHGVTADTIKADWKVSPEVERKRIHVGRNDVVTCLGLGKGAGRIPIPDSQRAEAERMRDDLEALNREIQSVEISGCLAPALRRVFRLDLRLGGRFYAVGASSYQNKPRNERPEMRINGEPVVEVDIHASALTMLLGLIGTSVLPYDDLYGAVEGFPREVVKAWMVQTFGTGKLTRQWGRGAPSEAGEFRPTEVREAVVRTYPALASLRSILPEDLVRKLPNDKVDWAVGQFLTNIESRVMNGALGYLRAVGVVGLPLHDAIIVPESGVEAACRGLQGASNVFAGIIPKLKH
jgi:hypothetical protein